MSVRNRFTALSGLVRLFAMLVIVLSLLPAGPISAAPAHASSPAPVFVVERASNPELRHASLWAASLPSAAQPASSAQPARAPDAPTITATMTDGLVNDVPPTGPTAGDTIRYTVVINNSGSDPASAVAFSDTIDPGTTLSGVAHVSPIAFDDSYDSLGNVGITVPAANGVLANDVDPDSNVSLSVIPAAGASANGAFAIASDGSFSYQPGAGYEGPDSFTYTLTDNDPLTPNDTGAVNITVNEVIWFINNTAAGPGDGRLNNPFNSLAGFNAAPNDPGDIIFIYFGSGSYGVGIVLKNNQVLVGDGSTATIQTVAGIATPPYSDPLPTPTGTVAGRPAITASGGTAIALANGNTVRGLKLGIASNGLSGTAVGNLVASEMSINTGAGTAVNINGGALNVSLDSVSSSAGANAGIVLQNTTGSFTVTGTGAAGSGGTISGKTGNNNGVTLNNAAGVSLAFMNINSNSQNGIFGQSINGLTLNNVTLDGNADQASPDEAGLLLLDTTGTVNITSSTIKNSYEHNVKVENNSGTLTAFNVTGGTIGPNPVGTGGQGLLFQGNGTANMTLSVNGTTFTGNQQNGIFADTSGGTMDVTIQGGTFTNNNVGPGVSVSGSGNMTFDILNNTASSPTQVQSIGINVFANASHNGTFVGTIAGNTVGQVGSIASGSIDGNGIAVKDEGGGTVTVLINNNTVREVGNGSFTGFEGIFAIKSVTAGTLNATVTNNTMDQIRDDRGLQVRSILGTVCSDIRGNQFSNIAGSTFLRVSQAVPGVFNLVQTSQANLSAVNNAATTTVSGAINFGASANCPTPTSAPEGPAAGDPASQPAATTSAAPSGSNASQPRAASPAPVLIAPIDQPVASVSTAITPAMAAVAGDDQFNHSTVPSAPDSGETVNVALGTLNPAQQVTIVFDVIIDTPTTPAQIVSQVCNQGTFTGGNFSNVLTDDPDVGGSANPTCTTLALGSITIAKNQVPDGSTVFGFTSTIPGNAAFNVNGDTSLPIANVTAGSYTATENDPAPASILTVLSCNDGASGVASSGNTGTRTASIYLEPGETIVCTFTNTDVVAAVTLASFDAAAQADHVLVTWETVSELNNAGFNLYRTETADPPVAADLLVTVPSQGPGSAQGYFYSYQDYAVTLGETYWYWLEDVDFSGATTMHGPVSVLFAVPTAVTLTGLEAASGWPSAPAWPLAVWVLSAALTAGVALSWRGRRYRSLP